MRKVQIGRYRVRAVADDVGGGQYAGTAHYEWDELGGIAISKLIFDKRFGTADEAEQHAIDQFALRVQYGEL